MHLTQLKAHPQELVFLCAIRETHNTREMALYLIKTHQNAGKSQQLSPSFVSYSRTV